MEQFKDVNRRKSKHKEKLNIAMFGQKRIPSREGGVEIVVEELCSRMVAQGHNVTCYDRGGHHVSGSEYDSKRLKEYKGIRLKTVPTIEKKGLAAVSSSFFAALCCAFGRYDIVHIHAEGPAFFAWLPKLFGKKVIVTIHGLDWQREKWKSGFGSKFIHQGEKNAVKYADEIIVLSKGVQDYFEKEYGRKTVFIPNGVNRPKIQLLESVLAQKNIYVDILARDDGSTDKTVEILKKYDRVKVYGGNNLKPAKSFLDLIWKADINYDYYALCDQDDVWKEEKIISAVKCIENIDKPALYSSAVEVVDKDLTFIRKSFTDNTFKNPLYDILTYGTPGCTFVFNKALMEKLKQYKPSVISMHDSWISFVCLAVNGFFYSDQNAYIMYRQHDANVLGAQRHSLKDTLRGIIKNKNVLRSDMAKEILKGYSEMMPEKTKEDFIFFAEYKDNLKYKLKILMLPYNKKKTTKRTFEKVKLRIVFNTI